jgi:hypothetical protein
MPCNYFKIMLCSFVHFCMIDLYLAFLLYISLASTFERLSIYLHLIFLSLLHSLTFGLCNLCGGLVVSTSSMLRDEHVASFAGFVESVSPVDFHSCVYPEA